MLKCYIEARYSRIEASVNGPTHSCFKLNYSHRYRVYSCLTKKTHSEARWHSNSVIYKARYGESFITFKYT